MFNIKEHLSIFWVGLKEFISFFWPISVIVSVIGISIYFNIETIFVISFFIGMILYGIYYMGKIKKETGF